MIAAGGPLHMGDAALLVVSTATLVLCINARIRRRQAGQVGGHLRTLQSIVPVGLVHTDSLHRILWCNDAFASLVARTREDLLGRTAWEVFHEDSPRPDLDAIAEVVAGRRSQYSAERLFRRPDGSAIPVQVDLALIHDGGQNVGAVARVRRALFGPQPAPPPSYLCAVTNISERTSAEELARREHERADVLWERAPVGIFETDADGVVLRVNEAFGDLLGYEPGELVGIRARDWAEAMSADQVDANLDALRAGRVYTAERLYRAQDGTPVPVYVASAVLRDQAGTIDRFVGFALDLRPVHAQRDQLSAALADLAEAHDELATRQAFTDALLESIDVGIASCDAQGNVVVCNPAAITMLGPGDVVPGSPATTNDIALFDARGERLPRERYPLFEALRGRVHGLAEFQLQRGDATARELLIRSSQLTAPSGTVVGAVVAMSDVTAEKAVKRELARAVALFEAILAATPDFIMVTDVVTGDLTYATPDRHVLGLEARELHRWSIAEHDDLTHPAGQVERAQANAAARVAADGVVISTRSRARHVDGTWHTIRRHITPLGRDAEGRVTHLLSVVRDITDLVTTEERLQLANANLSEFASVTAHDLRTPLAIVKMTAMLLAAEVPAGDPNPIASTAIERLIRAADRGLALVDETLARATNDIQDAPASPVELQNLAQEVALEQSAATGRNPVIRVHPLPTVVGDAPLLHQMLANLVGNAIKYTPAERTPRIEIDSVPGEAADEFILRIRDNGIGIPAQDRRRVFDMFQRSETGDAHGTGVGLAICRRAAEQHGGRIWVEDNDGDGSTFLVALPWAPAALRS